MDDNLCKKIWKQFEKGLAFNSKLNLTETVEENENFFIGKQWEGVVSNGLPTPTSNILKQIVLYQVASIGSDNLAMQATPLKASGSNKRLELISRIVSNEFDALFERNDVVGLGREKLRNAAVDGDGCLYSYWDDEVYLGNDSKGKKITGDIRTEVLENARVIFGNPNDRHVQSQPYIIIWKRRQIEEVKDRAKAFGASDETCGYIKPDTDENNSLFDSYVDDNVTVLLKLWRDKKTKTIHGCEVTKNAVVREEWDLGISLYPITWLNWDYIQGNYHGQALITGLIPNQKAINKLQAMTEMSMMMSAFPKIVYDKTRVTKWTNQVGAQIGVSGNVDGIAKILEPAQISPQVFQYIESMVEMTQNLTGATAAALGNVRPDNTSAILALQKASTIPSEITKQNYYRSIKDLGHIYLEFMMHYYGKREVDIAVKDAGLFLGEDVAEFAGLDADSLVTIPFDFAELKGTPMTLKLDVGASSMWSEISSTQTLENLAQWQMITPADMLDRLPAGTIPKLQELVEKYKAKERAEQQMLEAQQKPAPEAEEETDLVDEGEDAEIVGGAGYRNVQREINAQL